MLTTVQTEPLLLHLILELDCQRAPSLPPVKPQLTQNYGWVLDVDKKSNLAPMPGSKAAAQTATSAAETASEQDRNGLSGDKAEVEGNTDGTDVQGAAASKAEENTGGENVRANEGKEQFGKQDAAQSNGHLDSRRNESADGAGTSSHFKQEVAAQKPGSSPQAPSSKATAAGKGKQEDASKAEQLITLRCTLDDVSALTSHLDKFSEAWRRSVQRGCDGLRQAIIESKIYTPGTVQQLVVMHLLTLCCHPTMTFCAASYIVTACLFCP
jgi:hypothetical protein